MNDIFISYKSEDRNRAQQLAAYLEECGFTVWWDRNLVPGVKWDREIKEQLTSARCVIVLWSELSVESDWVKDEAEKGKERGVLFPVLIDRVDIPLGFGRIQAANLINWKSREDNPELIGLVNSIRTIVNQSKTNTERVDSDLGLKNSVNKSVGIFKIKGFRGFLASTPYFRSAKFYVFGISLVLLSIFLTMYITSLKPPTIVGKWKVLYQDTNNYVPLGLFVEVVRDKEEYKMNIVNEETKEGGFRIESLYNVKFDGHRWTFTARFRDGVLGYVVLNRVSDLIFEGALNTDNNEKEYRHKYVKIG